MTYSRFNRHENMNSGTRSEIMKLIRMVSDIDSVDDGILERIQNMLYGLFDGYLYDDLQLLALQLPTDLAVNVIKMYDICNRYPKIETA
jgi:hypothetical protein